MTEDKINDSVADKNDHKDDDIITLLTDEGEEVDFIEIAGIAYHGNYYVILQPTELPEGMSEDEAFVFRVSRNKKGEDKFEIELDNETVDAVFAEYSKLLDDAEGK